MKKMQKILIFENIHVDVISEHPKDISRCKVKLTEGSNNEGQQLCATYFSEQYGIVEPTSITWPSSISLQYHAQESIEFQTVCEHEFGYELADLKAIYKGIIYLISQNFFRESTTHIFNNEGQQCGLVRFVIKIQNKIINSPIQKQKPIEVEISTELIAKITLYSANLLLNPAYYYLQKDNMSLIVLYGKQEILSSKENNFMKWNFNKQKLSIMDNSNEIKNIEFIIQQNNIKIMNGFLQLKQLEQKKRFLIQNINMQLNTTGNKIGTLQIDMRYITKKQLFDLMYLPTQLSNTQLLDKNVGQNEQQSKHNKLKNSYQSLRDLQIKMNKSNSTLIHEKNKFTIKRINKNNQSLEINNLQINNNDILNKYKIYLMKPNNQSVIPKDKRFRRAHGQTINQNISYIDPEKLSDFSPRHKRGSSITTSNKTDFTKFVKMNPGVGKYYLPSIWQK